MKLILLFIIFIASLIALNKKESFCDTSGLYCDNTRVLRYEKNKPIPVKESETPVWYDYLYHTV